MKILPDWFTVLCIGNVYFHHSPSILCFSLMLLSGRKQSVHEFVGVFVHLLVCKYVVYEGMHIHVCVCVVCVYILIYYFRVFYYNVIRLFIFFNFCLWILLVYFIAIIKNTRKDFNILIFLWLVLFHFIQHIYQNVICCVWYV